jgi:hypothetical protein
VSLLHIGHEVTGGWLESAVLLALTFIVIWLHVMLRAIFKADSAPKSSRRRQRATGRRRALR